MKEGLIGTKMRTKKPGTKLYSTSSAAKYLGVSRQYVNRLIRQGKLPTSDVEADFDLIPFEELVQLKKGMGRC